MSKEAREVIADWMILIGALALFRSMFLTRSHQFSPAFLAQWGTSDLLCGVPHDRPRGRCTRPRTSCSRCCSRSGLGAVVHG